MTWDGLLRTLAQHRVGGVLLLWNDSLALAQRMVYSMRVVSRVCAFGPECGPSVPQNFVSFEQPPTRSVYLPAPTRVSAAH